VQKTVATYGRIDIAFNNAGTEGEFTPFLEQSNAVYDTIFNANVRGVFWSMKHEAKAMLAQARGSIINNASMAVNAICPDLINTPFQDRVWGSEQAKKEFGAASVPGRMGTPEEMATVVAFLASDDASFVSGQGLIADGGYTAA
jgi:NAD(P)-dependent dehydrogenase (short-subunit alcohol dehydrogenase family)